jgi:hypothetical protein
MNKVPPGETLTTKHPAETRVRLTETQKFWYAVVCVFTLALGLRLAYFLCVRDGNLTMTDTRGYVELAESLQSRGEYTSDYTQGGFPGDLIRPPGYPSFLLVVNGFRAVDLERTALIQSIIGAVWAAGFTLIVAWLTTRWTGILAGAFYAAECVTIVHTPLVLTDLLYSIPETLALLSFVAYLKTGKTWQAALAGTGLAAAALVRPQAWLLLIVLIIGWFLQPHRRIAGLAFLVTYIVFVSPWAVRNYIHHGVLTLSTVDTEMINLIAHTAMDHGAVDDAFYKRLDKNIVVWSTEWERDPLSPLERERAHEHEAFSILYHNARWALKQFAVGMVHTSLGTGQGTVTASLPKGLQGAFRWYSLVVLEVVMLWGLALAGIFYSNALPKAAMGMLAAALFLIVFSPGIIGYGRYRVPVVPILCMFAAMGASALWVRYHGVSQRAVYEHNCDNSILDESLV